MNDAEDRCIKNMLTVLGEERVAEWPDPETLGVLTGLWRVVRCPSCSKVICKATPGSTVHVLCNRCKTESVTEIAA